tara:strand:- start:266 stop:862 length:597 start_codon:yes stop_codon:yes gene_type:complete
MADVSTDIASNVNITARRGDTFILELSALNTGVDQVSGVLGSVIDSDGDGVADTIDMTALQYTGDSGTIDDASPNYRWGAKMTIADASSGDAKLSVFSPYYEDQAFNDSNNVLPAPTTEGKWYGKTAADGGINLDGTSAAAGKIKIKVPASYMAALEPGTYNYDFQVRKKVYAGLDAEITTWIYGTFIVTADITSGTS